MSWYKKALLSTYHKELIVGGLVFVVLFVLSIVQLISGELFAWRQIEPFSTPDLWNRIFWSALTFVSLGAILYHIYFYKFLSDLFGSNRGGYRQAKAIVWFGLMCVNYQIFPTVVDIANSIVSFAFNASVYIMYVSPMLMTGIIFGMATGLIVERKAVARLILQL